MLIKEENLRFILGLKIKQLRKNKNLSQTELANAADISVSYLNEIESGKKYPKREKLFVISSVLGTTYNDIVSIDSDASMKPLLELLKSNFLHEIPFEDFGIDVTKLFDVFSKAPVRTSAFVNTFFEMIRRYEIPLSDFYLSALRSYVEMRQNHFEEIEALVYDCYKKIVTGSELSIDLIQTYLINNFKYEISFQSFNNNEKFRFLRNLYSKQPNKHILVINRDLTQSQILFILCRELGYQILNIIDHPSTDPQLLDSKSFDEYLNNYKSKYFASAFLMPLQESGNILQPFFNLTEWQPEEFIKIMSSFPVSPETFFHRLTTVLPSLYKINSLFFLKIVQNVKLNSFGLTKELHLGGLHGPHATIFKENYCRRWISMSVLNKIDKSQVAISQSLPSVQTSSYIFSNRSYFCLSLPRQSYPNNHSNTSLTIGIEITAESLKHIKFINSNIPTKQVGVTCERCPDHNCTERAANYIAHVDLELLESEIFDFIKSLTPV